MTEVIKTIVRNSYKKIIGNKPLNLGNRVRLEQHLKHRLDGIASSVRVDGVTTEPRVEITLISPVESINVEVVIK